MRTVAISGSSGFIGSALLHTLQVHGYVVRPLGRGSAAAEGLAGADAVVNLAGENIAQRWTREARQRIRVSRVETTSAIARGVAAMKKPPGVLISGSAIGVYGADRGDEVLDESSRPGDDFLASVCQEWEAATAPASEAGVRVVHLRTGIVLDKTGGALAKMLPIFSRGLGGPLGAGNQWMSWIALADEVAAIELLMNDGRASGPVNVVGPTPATNLEFSRALGLVLHRSAALRAPRFALKLLMGEMAEATALASQRVLPRRLEALGFRFEYPQLGAALKAALSSAAATRRSARSSGR